MQRCCGPQLSKDYRLRLYGKVENVNVTHFKPMSKGPGDVNYDACDLYDIDAVERASDRRLVLQVTTSVGGS